MKRRDLLQLIANGARKQGIEWRLLRQGADHEIWRCGSLAVHVPRHRDLNQVTAKRTLHELERVFGKEWWRS